MANAIYRCLDHLPQHEPKIWRRINAIYSVVLVMFAFSVSDHLPKLFRVLLGGGSIFERSINHGAKARVDRPQFLDWIQLRSGLRA